MIAAPVYRYEAIQQTTNSTVQRGLDTLRQAKEHFDLPLER